MEEQTSTPATAAELNVSERVSLHDKIVEKLRTIYDPEIPVNIYDLGLIYEVKVEPTAEVYVKMTLTSPGCPCRRHASRRSRGQDRRRSRSESRESGCGLGANLDQGDDDRSGETATGIYVGNNNWRSVIGDPIVTFFNL